MGDNTKTYKDVRRTMSEVKVVSEGQAVWELKNWNDPNHFNMLKKNASCLVNAGDVSLRFFFKDDPLNTSYSRYLQLCATVNSSKTSKTLVGSVDFAIKVTMHLLDDELTVKERQQGYETLYDKYLTTERMNTEPELVVEKHFIELSGTKFSNGIKSFTKESEMPQNLIYGITVQVLKCVSYPNSASPCSFGVDHFDAKIKNKSWN